MRPQLALHLYPHVLARMVVSMASISIITALLLVHFIPWRFRIHPYPYLSDAGLRDPERVILSFGLAVSATLFLPVAAGLYLSQQKQLEKVREAGHRNVGLRLLFTRRNLAKKETSFLYRKLPCEPLPRLGLQLGVMLSFFLALFTAIPGWFFLHHVFALFFAMSAALWCLCHTLFSHAISKLDMGDWPKQIHRVRVMYILVVVQGAVICLFGIVWASVKLQIPYKMIPNKDFRFIILAGLEYLGTGSFLTFIGLVSHEMKKSKIRLEISLKMQKVNEADSPRCTTSV